jgi:hypothetical protein
MMSFGEKVMVGSLGVLLLVFVSLILWASGAAYQNSEHCEEWCHSEHGDNYHQRLMDWECYCQAEGSKEILYTPFPWQDAGE